MQTFLKMADLFTWAPALAGELLFACPGPPPVPQLRRAGCRALSTAQPRPAGESRLSCPRCTLQDADSWDTLVYPVCHFLGPGKYQLPTLRNTGVHASWLLTA